LEELYLLVRLKEFLDLLFVLLDDGIEGLDDLGVHLAQTGAALNHGRIAG